MFSDSRNVAVLAAAGARKTDQIIETALASEGRVLITTFTNENCNQIRRRIQQRVGIVPPNITLMGWFSFLIAHGAKPYQASLTKEPFVATGLNFDGTPPDFTKKEDA